MNDEYFSNKELEFYTGIYTYELDATNLPVCSCVLELAVSNI